MGVDVEVGVDVEEGVGVGEDVYVGVGVIVGMTVGDGVCVGGIIVGVGVCVGAIEYSITILGGSDSSFELNCAYPVPVLELNFNTSVKVCDGSAVLTSAVTSHDLYSPL